MGVVEGHCDPHFASIRDLFEASFASGEEIGAAIAFCLDGRLVVDLWGGHLDPARTQPCGPTRSSTRTRPRRG